MSQSVTKRTPLKYRSSQQHTRKEWLYEQYWGELRSIHELADDADVSHTTIMREMEQKGVPRRPKHMEPSHHEGVAHTLHTSVYTVSDDTERRVVWSYND